MIEWTSEQLCSLLEMSSQPLLLFRDHTLAGHNKAALRLLPELTLGDQAQALLPQEATESLRLLELDPKAARLLTAFIAGEERELRITPWQDMTLVEIAPALAQSQALLASVAQGLLSPLSGLMAVTPELLRQLPEPMDPEVQDLAAQVSRGTYALFRAANHLRLCSDMGNLSVSLQSGNLSSWLSGQYDLLLPLVESARRTLELQLPKQDYLCLFDPEKLGLAMLNLVSNALKFTGPGGHIILQLKKTASSRICLVVKDDGCGVAPDQLGMLFHRADSPRLLPDPRWGVGLGLPLARAILQQHGGSLIVESQEGSGTSVYLALQYSTRATMQPIRSGIQRPTPYGGFSPALVELADALPGKVYDHRDLNG